MITANEGHDMMHTRESDTAPIKVTREIPLWALVSALGAFAMQAVALYYGQIDLAKTQAAQTESIRNLTNEVRTLSAAIGAKDMKDLEHDYKIRDLDGRVTKTELNVQQLQQQKGR